jgi:hypothetical protein
MKMDSPMLTDIAAKPTTFVYQGVRFAYSPGKGLSFRSGSVSVRMVDPSTDAVYRFLDVYLDGRYLGSFSKNSSTANASPTPKLWQTVRLGIDAWAAENEKRSAANAAARQKSIQKSLDRL